MSDDLVFRADGKEVVAALEAIRLNMLKTAKAGDKLVVTTEKISKTSKGFRATIKATDGVGKTYSKTIERIGNRNKVLSQTFDENTAKIKKFRIEQEKATKAAKDAASRRGTAQQIDQRIRSDIGPQSGQQGFRVNDQIAALKKLVRATKISGKEINKVWAQVQNGQVEAYEGDLLRIQKQMRKVVAETKRVDTASKGLGVSWASIGRFAGFTLAAGALFKLQSLISDAARNGIELSKRLGEIRSITVDNTRTTDEWSRALREQSDAFGLDILDQAESAYQIISSQVADGADTFKVLAGANKLAVASLSTTSEATNLLTAALQSYGLSTSEVDRVSAQFFETVRLGRLRIRDISDDIGRTTVLAAQLGIPLEEVNGVLATLTVQGQKPAVVLTQLRAVMLKLIKPTESLSKVVNNLGFDSPADLFGELGFVNGLRLLQEETKGSTTELAQLFSRLRAIQGIVGASANLELLAANIDKISASGENFNTAFAENIGTAGKTIEIELERIRNSFRADLVSPVIEGLTDLLSFGVPVSETVGLITKSLIGLAALGLVGATAATLKYTSALIANNAALATNLKGVGKINAAVLLAAAAYFVINSAAELYIETQDELIDADKKATESFQKRVDARVRAARAEFNGINRALRDSETVLRTILSRYTKATDAAIDNIEVSFKDGQTAIKSFSKATQRELREAARATEREIGIIDTTLEKIKDTIANITTELTDDLFQLDFDVADPSEQLRLIQRRIAQLTEQADSATAFGDFDTADAAFKRIRQLIIDTGKIQQKVIADNTKAGDKRRQVLQKSAATERKIEEDIERLRDSKRGKDRKERRKIDANISKLESKRKASLQKTENALSRIKTTTVETFNTEKALTDNANDRIEAYKNIQTQLEANRKSIEATNKAQEKQLALLIRAQAVVAKADIKGLREAESPEQLQSSGTLELAKFEALRTQLKELGTDASREELKVLDAQIKLIRETVRLRKEEFEAVNSIRENSEKRKSVEKELLETLDDQRVVVARARELSKNIGESFGRDVLLRGLEGGEGTVSGGAKIVAARGRSNRLIELLGGDKAVKELDFFIALAQKSLVDGIGRFDLNLLKLQGTDIRAQLKGITKDAGELPASTTKVLTDIIRLINAINKVDPSNTATIEKLRKQQEQLKAQAKALTEQFIPKRAEEEAKANKTISSSLDELGKANHNLAKGITARAVALERLNRARSGATGKQSGGFQSGGLGTDSIRTALSPGEFVVNASAARSNIALLRKINSGGAFQSGGSTTNVGDINITVEGSSNPNQTGVALFKQIKMAKRRKLLDF